jgi:ABC-2 type transport system permease protein
VKTIAKYTWIAYTAARSNLAYAAESASRVVFMTLILFIFMKLWIVVYAAAPNGKLAGLTLPSMLWYLVITEAILLSSPRVWAEVDQDVRTGRLTVQLIHPVSYVFSHLGKSMGERIVRFAINLAAGSAVAMVLAGPVRITISGVASFVLILPLAFALDFFGNFLVGLGAFWLESTAGLALIYSRLTMLLGGIFFPIEIYPLRLQPVIRMLPFASMLYAPARMFVDPEASLLRGAIVQQGISLLTIGIAVYVVQTLALRRVFSNGG